MVMKHRIIVNKYNSDIKCMVTVVALMPFIVMTLVGMLNSFEYMLKWWWTTPLISAVFLIMFATSEPFKIWMLSREDLKGNRVIKKQIVVEEFKNNYSLSGHHHGNILERILFDLVYREIEQSLKTVGGDEKYTITDTENNTYRLMNFYKTKMRKKDIKGALSYSSLKGRKMEIEYLEKSKIILSINMDKATKSSKLIGGFWEIFGGYII
ncbi:MAG: hypothetical protein IJO83_04240 [Clostridia bacterium]|nr:hypothetical protein [Clostridia bacterium]